MSEAIPDAMISAADIADTAISDAAISTSTAHAGTLDFDTAVVSAAEESLSLENGHISESPSNSQTSEGSLTTESTETAAAPNAAPLDEDGSMSGDPNIYDAESIQTLEGMEAVRMRPGMYIGGTGSEGFAHLLWELIDNAVDEAAAGFGNQIDVIFHRDNSMEVRDKGRGVPVDMHPTRGVSALEVVFTELHAGGKFGGGAYGASGGLHGVGAAVVNALSTRMEVEVDREGRTWVLGFKNQTPVYKKRGFKEDKNYKLFRSEKPISKTKSGTRVRYWPDREIFDPGVEIPFEEACERLRLACYLVPGLKVKAEDKRAGAAVKDFEFQSKKGLVDYVNHLCELEAPEASQVTGVISLSGSAAFEEKVAVSGKTTTVQKECQVEIAMRWVNGFQSEIRSFVNTIPTPDGGTHLAGFDRALLFAVNDRLMVNAKPLAKLARTGQSRGAKEDIYEGLVAVVQVSFPEPQFQGQTKRRLGTPAAQKIVYDTAKDGLVHWLEKDGARTHVNALRDKIANAVLSRVAARQTLENKRKAASISSTGMPDKLADCRTLGPSSELIIVEGESAAGPAKMGRNAEHVAILPLRGKVVNASKSSAKQVLANAEASALFAAIGTGVGEDFDMEKARYGRIIILCDADVDGSHIRCLLLTLIHKYMRPMLEAGMIYSAQPPLYTTKIGDEIHRAFTEEERDQITQELAKGNRKAENIRWQRFKGLGEMNVDELAECALNPETRILRKMTIQDAQAAEAATQMFATLMGSNVEARRDYLTTNSTLIDPEALDI